MRRLRRAVFVWRLYLYVIGFYELSRIGKRSAAKDLLRLVGGDLDPRLFAEERGARAGEREERGPRGGEAKKKRYVGISIKSTSWVSRCVMCFGGGCVFAVYWCRIL